MPDSTLEPKERIDVLLVEYNALRSEILTIRTHQGALIALTGVALTFLVQAGSDSAWLGFLFVVIAIPVLMLVWYTDMRRCAKRIAAIERKVNKIAGEELLEWERRWGGAGRSWKHWFNIRRRDDPDPPPHQ